MFTEPSPALGTWGKSVNNAEIPAHRERTFLHEVIEEAFTSGVMEECVLRKTECFVLLSYLFLGIAGYYRVEQNILDCMCQSYMIDKQIVGPVNILPRTWK